MFFHVGLPIRTEKFNKTFYCTFFGVILHIDSSIGLQHVIVKQLPYSFQYCKAVARPTTVECRTAFQNGYPGAVRAFG